MFLFNLSLAEFLALFTASSALLVALYLLDRSRRRVLVATLRFWQSAERPVESTRRRAIRQWPSLLLQLASVTCLLLALSQLRLGSREDFSRDHVLILDTSAWMAASASGSTLMEQARGQALAYLRAIPSTDRVMLITADTLATPVTSFESDRRKLEDAVRRARPGEAALDLRQALDYARAVQRRGARRSGEIVFAGAGRLPDRDALAAADLPANLRLLSVSATLENVGFRKIGLRRSPSEADLWQIFVSVRNYGSRDQTAEIALQFGGAPAGSRRLRLAPAAEQEASFELRTRAAGLLEARLRARGDAFPLDDRAVIELPQLRPLLVTVCSDQPLLLRPLLESHHGVQTVFRPTAQCDQGEDSGIVIYDRFVPGKPGKAHAVYIEPPPERSPIRVLQTVSAATLESWRPDHPLSAGLRIQDLRLPSTRVFALGPEDSLAAQSSAGPVIVARSSAQPGAGKLVAIGFHPTRGSMRFELATPLLFANILRWMEPESFRRWEITAASIGSVTVPLEDDSGTVRVQAGDGVELPFSVHGSTLRFFSGKPGNVRVLSGDREQVYSLTLPEIPETVWEAPPGVRRGVPRPAETPASSRDLWRWLALAGALGLLAEWWWFAPGRLSRPQAMTRVRLAGERGQLARRAS